jgi:hypothetical protein
MGGSSLCAEVLRDAGGVRPGSPELHVLDTTDEQTIARAAAQMVPERTLFLVASKSGGTIEVTALERFFMERMREAGIDEPGRHFVAITDPGTPLEQLARTEKYRHIFLNPADIGGRFSALSLFGLVPAALMGLDVGALLDAGAAMAEGCRQENVNNPGLALGAAMAVAAEEGRDKLTLLLPPSISTLGLWIEQLVAESTGKLDRGILPVIDEPLGQPDDYRDDRFFVVIDTDDDEVSPERVKSLESAGHPVLRLGMRRDGLGAEFFRWEFAVAVAGAMLGINPFDEPNVKEAKDRTGELIATFTSQRKLPADTPLAADGPYAVYGDGQKATGSVAVRLRSLIDSVGSSDYVAFLSYLPADRASHEALQSVRAMCRNSTRAATTVGVGPRYLHSTGQYHKGGPNRGVFIVITADDRLETRVPGMPYSFAVLKRAQALGDFKALQAHARRALRLHVNPVAGDEVIAVKELLESVLNGSRPSNP